MADQSERSEPAEETVHYGNGNVKMRGAYLEGEMHGDWTWYRTDGSVMRTGQLDHGRQVGTWPTFDRSGRLVKETTFGESPA
jgi:antitoxin component YwqK of YwqJK toxin-antitoxin module